MAEDGSSSDSGVINPPPGGFTYGEGGTVDQVQSGELDTVENDDGSTSVVPTDSGSSAGGNDAPSAAEVTAAARARQEDSTGARSDDGKISAAEVTAAARAREQVASQNEDIDTTDVDVGFGGSGSDRTVSARVEDEAVAEIQRENLREQALEQATSETGRSTSDFETEIVETEQGMQARATLSEEARQEQQQQIAEANQRTDQNQFLGTQNQNVIQFEAEQSQDQGPTYLRASSGGGGGSTEFLLQEVDTRGGVNQQATQSTQAPSTTQPDVSADQAIVQEFTTGGFLAEEGSGFDPASGEFAPTEEQLGEVSQTFQQGLDVVAETAGGSRQLRFDGNQLELTQPQDSRQGVVGSAVEGGVRGIGQIGDIPGLIQTGETTAEIAETTGAASIDLATNVIGRGTDLSGVDDNLGATAETVGVVGGELGTAAGQAAVESVTENPAETVGLLAGGAASSLGVGAAGQAGFIGLRGRAATRGLDFQGDVDFQDIERPDVRSGQSRLTRFSEDAVPGGDRSMNPDDFPAETANLDTAQELQNLAREFDDPRVREALDTGPQESVLFSARSGVKPERFEPRSGRPFDPDAGFFAGSVSRNFLDIEGSPDAGDLSGGVRRPRPIEAGRSLIDAFRQEDNPTVTAVAGDVEMFPEDIVSARSDRAEMTDFLQENRNTGRFFTLRPEAESGEAEALVSAAGASKDDPLPGAGRVESGEATTFVETADPFVTELRGERVPIQLFRQDTGDVTPRSEQGGGLFGEFLSDTRAQAGATRGTGGSSIETESTGGQAFTPGGRPGTPLAPPAGIFELAGGGERTDTVSRSETASTTERTTQESTRLFGGSEPSGRALGTRGSDLPDITTPFGPTGGGRETDQSGQTPFGPTGSNRESGSGGSPFGPFGGGSETTPPGNGQPPSEPPGQPPSTPPSTPPETPPSTPPSTPPGTPPSTFGGSPPSGPPSVPSSPTGGTPFNPFAPGSPTGGPSRPPRTPGLELDAGDSDDEDELQVAPEGQEFENPIASGEQFLFGTGFRESDFADQSESTQRAEAGFAQMFGVDDSGRTEDTTENLFGMSGSNPFQG